MESATIGLHVNIHVVADFDASDPATIGRGIGTGLYWYRIDGGGGEPILEDVTDEVNVDRVEVLRNAVSTVFSDHPADRRGIVFWDHGGAWQGGFGGDSQNGTIAYPDTSLSAREISDGISSGFLDADIDEEPPLFFLLFNTCLMAGPEVFIEFDGITDIFFGDAEIDYGKGWDYQSSLTWISENSDPSVEDFAAAMIEHFDAHHTTEDSPLSDELLRTHVAIDMAEVGPFSDAWHDLTETMMLGGLAAAQDVGRASFFSLPGYWVQVAEPSSNPDLRDIGHFLNSLSRSATSPGLSASARTAAEMLDEMIIDSSLGDYRVESGQVGVHIELPAAVNIGDRLPGYRTNAERWDESTDWGDALEFLQTWSDSTAPTLSVSGRNLVDPTSFRLPTLTFSSADSDVAMAVAKLNYLSATDRFVLGLQGMGGMRSGFEYMTRWDCHVVSVEGQWVHVEPWIVVGEEWGGDMVPELLSVPGTIDYRGETFFAKLLLNGDILRGLDVTIDTSIVVFGGRPHAFDLRRFAGGEFRPRIPAYNRVTGIRWNYYGPGISIPVDGELDSTIIPASAGSYEFYVVGYDHWGNGRAYGEIVTLSEAFDG